MDGCGVKLRCFTAVRKGGSGMKEVWLALCGTGCGLIQGEKERR